MKQFSIKQLESFSSIKAHTIRTWEKRFQLFEPERIKGNVRTYSLDDVCRLLDICLLNEYGYKISRLKDMPADEMAVHIAALKSESGRQLNSINKLLKTMLTNDTEEYEAELDKCLLAWGIDSTINHIIIPFMEKAQLLSYKVSTVQAHFAVTALRRKLILGIEKSKLPAHNAKTALLFLPENEHYDLMLLYMHYMLKNHGLKIMYLGTNISIDNLRLALQDKQPDCLYSYIADKNNFPIKEYELLRQNLLPDAAMYIAYAEDMPGIDIDMAKDVHFFRHTEMLQNIPDTVI